MARQTERTWEIQEGVSVWWTVAGKTESVSIKQVVSH